MVNEHIVKIEEKEREEKGVSPNIPSQGHAEMHQMQGKIEKEVNRLIFQKQSQNILAFKQLWEKEQSKKRYREKDSYGLTSSHHMALEAAIRRVRAMLHSKRNQTHLQ